MTEPTQLLSADEFAELFRVHFSSLIGPPWWREARTAYRAALARLSEAEERGEYAWRLAQSMIPPEALEAVEARLSEVTAERDAAERRYDLKHSLYENIVTVICEEWFIAFAKLTKERDAANARAAELSEAMRETWAHFSVTGDRDAMDACPDCRRLRTLAAQPPSERGKALLDANAAMKAAIEKYGRCTTCSGTGTPRDPCDGQYCRCKPGAGGRADTCWNCKGAKLQSWALAAIDGATT